MVIHEAIGRAELVEPGTYLMEDSQKEFSIAAVFKDRQMGVTSISDVKETAGKLYSKRSCHIKEYLVLKN